MGVGVKRIKARHWSRIVIQSAFRMASLPPLGWRASMCPRRLFLRLGRLATFGLVWRSCVCLVARCCVFYCGLALVAWRGLVTIATGEEAGRQALSIVIPLERSRLCDAW